MIVLHDTNFAGSRLLRKPGNPLLDPKENDVGAGSHLGLQIMVQNRCHHQAEGSRVVMIRKEILAVGMPRGSSVLLEGMKSGEVYVKIPHSNKLVNFNEKEVNVSEKPPAAFVNAKNFSVALECGEYVIFELHYHVGGPRNTLEFHALEKLEFGDFITSASINQSVVSWYFEDYRTYGKEAFIASHYGEARAKMFSVGQNALVEMIMHGDDRRF
ncbi:hypothetical protein BT96DRAFT_935348 [Gymnopus androsaceus JB14]|uniref:Uncharacterized protein n=1 Tax=Gymnopus androsaceus JB14 TaxID=1447944 RepID=A0A6A4I725_9AGAR|nr:hypothetical protein BT96DRAFT_935348 [Gymnopus androsaceus JB14]